MTFRSKITIGFTLVELLSTLSIASILTVGAAPSFQLFIERTRVTTAVNNYMSYLHLARSEAISRSQRVVLCPSLDGIVCIADYTQWAQGFIVFVDADNNKSRDDDEPLIRYYQGEENAIKVYSSSNYRKVVAYYPTGMAFGFNTTIRFCATHSVENNRAVIISGTGRPRLSETMANGSEVVCS